MSQWPFLNACEVNPGGGIEVSVVCSRCPTGLSPHSNASDCGYSSSMEGSETGSRGGSDVACTEVFNHDDAGQRRGQSSRVP